MSPTMHLTEEQAQDLRRVLMWVEARVQDWDVVTLKRLRELRALVPPPPKKKPDTRGDR